MIWYTFKNLQQTCCEIFKVCLTILGRYAFKGLKENYELDFFALQTSVSNRYSEIGKLPCNMLILY